jgi:hypothetical protein
LFGGSVLNGHVLGHLYSSILLKINEIVIYSSLFPVAGRLNVFSKDMVKTDARTIGGWVELKKF